MKSTVVHQMPICDLFPIPFLSDHTPQFCKNFPSYIQEVTVTLFYGLFLNAGFHNLKGKSEGLGTVYLHFKNALREGLMKSMWLQ